MKLRLTRSTFRTLSNISADMGQVFFGAVVGASALLELDLPKALVVLSNLLFAFGFWLLSIYFAEKGKL